VRWRPSRLPISQGWIALDRKGAYEPEGALEDPIFGDQILILQQGSDSPVAYAKSRAHLLSGMRKIIMNSPRPLDILTTRRMR
jgi:hypothetical protein